MKAVMRLFGNKERIVTLIKELKPELKDYYIIENCLDNTVYFEDVANDDFMDLLDELDSYVYNDRDISLEHTLVEFLRNNSLTIATAESCTGGMVASAIINVAGASSVFYEGIISYSNDSKEKRLNVNPDILDEFGAVSQETAMEMAEGLICREVDVAISTTGIAGPDGGSEDKPVGTVYIGIADKKRAPIAVKNHFCGNREQIRKSAKNAALFNVLRYLQQNY